MFNQIKIYLAGIIAAAFAFLMAYAKYQSNQKDKYKAESELNKSKAEAIDKRVEAHEKREEIEQDNANASSNDIDDGLQQYYRD